MQSLEAGGELGGLGRPLLGRGGETLQVLDAGIAAQSDQLLLETLLLTLTGQLGEDLREDNRQFGAIIRSAGIVGE